MALDGIMLHHTANELSQLLVGGKIEKIQQPSRDELIITFHSNGTKKMLICIRADCPRVGITKSQLENPAQPPMYCMLLRKRLGHGKLIKVEQLGTDRVLRLSFECFGELGDKETLRMYIEIMGRCSNSILTDENDKIIDAQRRVDGSMSMTRLVLPGLTYTPPPSQGKLSVLENASEVIAEAIVSQGDVPLNKAIMSKLDGVSPIVARELAFKSCGETDKRCSLLQLSEINSLKVELENFSRDVKSGVSTPVMLMDNGAPKDISFMHLTQYGEGASFVEFESFSELLDAFYAERNKAAGMKVRSADILRLLTTACDRTARTLTKRRAELENAKGREHLKLCGDLLNANIYRLKKGDLFAELENYYSEDYEAVRIELDPRLTPAQNAQRYYKEYRKLQTAEEHLLPLIAAGERELLYLDSVFDELSRAETNAELNEIRQELIHEGYIKRKQKDKQKSASLAPLKFRSEDGYEILCGRNNRQNEQLTHRDAERGDLWLHASKQPGSHVIIRCDDAEPSPLAIEQAAVIAAVHSKGEGSGLVAVDYTLVRKVSRHPSGRPGMVLYTEYKTLFVHPDAELVAKLSSESKKKS